MKKELCVLIPTYNVELYIEECITSILNQTYSEFDLIILDDASEDKTIEIIQKLANKDSRIKLYLNEKNEGIIESRNKLFELSDHEYIAIMDSDDIAYPTRLEKQLNFLKKNKRYGIVSSNFRIIPLNTVANHASFNDCIKETMIFINIINNPSTMFVSRYMKDNNILYDPDYRGSSDYKFWIDLLKFTDAYILDEVLVDYRRHGIQESTKNRTRQKEAHAMVTYNLLKEFNIGITLKDTRNMIFPNFLMLNEKKRILELYMKILKQNKKINLYDTRQLSKVVKIKCINLLLNEGKKELFTVWKIFEIKDLFFNYPLIKSFFKGLFQNNKIIQKHPLFQAKILFKKIEELKEKKFSIYATGEITEALFHIIENSDLEIKVEKIFDMKALNSSFNYKEYIVSSPNDISKIKTKVILIASKEFKDEILSGIKNILGEKFEQYKFITV